MAWIETHQELPRHPKTYELASLLGVSQMEAVGLLVSGWLWALQFAKDGYISERRLVAAAGGVGWTRDPAIYASAMVDAGWWDVVDGGWRIHDWEQYTGKLIERRKVDAERKASLRPSSPSNPKPIQSMSSGQHADGGRTVPNPTVPNQPLPHARATEAAAEHLPESQPEVLEPKGSKGWDFSKSDLEVLNTVESGMLRGREVALRIGHLLMRAVEQGKRSEHVVKAYYSMEPARCAAWVKVAMDLAEAKARQRSTWLDFAAGAIGRALESGEELVAPQPAPAGKLVSFQASPKTAEEKFLADTARLRPSSEPDAGWVRECAEKWARQSGARVDVNEALAVLASQGLNAALLHMRAICLASKQAARA